MSRQITSCDRVATLNTEQHKRCNSILLPDLNRRTHSLPPDPADCGSSNRANQDIAERRWIIMHAI
jgi:hypothetical protein